MTAIYILWLRQIKRYLRSKSRIIGSLGQPVLFLLAFGFGFGPIFEKAGGLDYMTFLAPGIIMMSILFTAVFNGIEMLWDRKFGFLKETFVAPVSRFNIIIGRTLGGATVAVFQGIIVFFLTMLFGFRVSNYLYLPLALLIMFLVAVLFTAVGTAIASLIDDMQGFGLIVNFVIMPLFFFSGALFPLQNLPKILTIIARLNPLAYGVDGLQHVLTMNVHFGLATDFLVLSSVTILLLALTSYLFSRIKM